ncbi:MAG TPA: hypothetical protein VFD06_05875 [Candidatus Polarisedimenticolia bacterium]|nr:hypothetical protein [Candidatus Polarisedimenticolia bacterium]
MRSRHFAGALCLAAALLALPAGARGAGQPRAGAEAAGQELEGPAAARRADLVEFREKFFEQDRSYPAAARAEAEARLARLEKEAAGMEAAAFELEVARIVALADNGHTVSFPGPRSRRYDRIPVRFVPFGERFFVLRAREPLSDLLGAELVAIDGRPMSELRAAARSLAGGVPSRRDRFASLLFESPEQLFALGFAAARDAATYRFAAAGGTNVERRIAAEPADPARPRGNADRFLFPDPVEGEGSAWRTLLAPAQAPASLREPDVPFRWRPEPGIEAIVIELRQNNDSGGRPIDRFLREATGAVRDAQPKNVVLDMRLNPGGDLGTTRDFAEGLPALVPGRIFVLTSPWTFSAAISTVGYLKAKAPSRVTIVGEPVGDRLVFFAEGRPVTLTNTGIVLLPATQRHDYRNGCRDFTDCHGAVVRHPIAVPTLDPEIAAPWTIEAYRSGRDPGMEAVAAALARKS